jgi:hypothetical protein
MSDKKVPGGYMKKIFLLAMLMFGVVQVARATDEINFWQQRIQTSNCSALTDGAASDMCYEQSTQRVYICDPSGDTCSSPSDWKLITGAQANETDPVWTTDSANYYNKTAADLRYLQSYTESDPTVNTSSKIQNIIGSGVYQPSSSSLTSYAGVAPSANALTLLGETFAQMLTSIGAQPAGSYLTSESDPIWSAAASNYYNKTTTDGRYLQNYTETDPIWSAASSNYYNKTTSDGLYYNKTTSDGLYYNKTASDGRYLQNYNETDPVWNAAKENYYNKTDADGLFYNKTIADTRYVATSDNFSFNASSNIFKASGLQYPSVDGSAGNLLMTLGNKILTFCTALFSSGNQYYSNEYIDSNVTGNYTVDWDLGNVHYLNITGNATIVFSNPKPGARYIADMAYTGNYTPTLPNTTVITWGSNTTPSWTCVAGQVDTVTLKYSGARGKYTGGAVLNQTL